MNLTSRIAPLFSRKLPVAACTVCLGLLAGCSPSRPAPSADAGRPGVRVEDALVQHSLVAALAAGDYRGSVPLANLLRDGDFGVGTFDRLAGEMIVLDGRIYQALADRTVREAPLTDTCPFAAVTFFRADGKVAGLAAASLGDLDTQLDKALPHRNLPYALRIDGTFQSLSLRSVPAQQPPFEPLVDVVQHQVTWTVSDVRGTLIGLRCPAWIGTLNVTGYHWHFLSDDRRTGGHVLDCAFHDAQLQYDACTSLVIRLPQSAAFDQFDSQQIEGADIEKIERQRAAAK